MSARELITGHLDLWTGAVMKKSSSGRGSNGKVELTGVKKLRELILELALSGRLVEPELDEEPAHHLLSRIEVEKSRLAAQGLIKKPKKLPEASDSQPYSLPRHWCWVRLGSVTNYGTTDKAEPNQVAENTWVLELEDIEKESSRLLSKVRYMERQFKSSKNRFERDDVLYGKLRPYLDKVLVADEPGVCTTEIIPIRSYLGLLPEFLRLALKSPSFKRYANDSTHGMNLPRLGTDKARLAMIPLAPEQEQHRIVQKVDELMALCDRLEQQTSDQLEAHETLVDTLLGTLTQSENATELADNWARLAAHFDTLFTTEQSIDKLKQTILQLAVEGRLVEQDAKDGCSKYLLQKVRDEQETLIRAKKMKKPKAELNIQSLSTPHALPSSWNWACIAEISYKITDGEHSTPKRSHDGHYLLSARNVTNDGIKLDDVDYVPQEEFERIRRRCDPNTGDILISCSGSVGRVALVDRDSAYAMVRSAAMIRPAISYFDIKYLRYALQSPCLQSQIIEGSRQSAQANLFLGAISKLLVPIPPLSEQHRIVQKVDELTALCDQLKERLNQASETRCQLALAVVEGALN